MLRNALMFCLLYGSVAAAQAVVYVDASRPGGNGTSWSQAYRTIEAAVNASGSGQEIWVARGNYTPNQPINLRANTRLLGGFAGTETSAGQRNVAANPTVVDGQNSLVHVLVVESLAPGCVIDGFHIRRGRAQGSFGWNSYGGGIFVNLQPTTIANCSFSNNSAVVYGGGIFVNRASVTISNCLFVGNTAGDGGAIAVFDQSLNLIESRFTGNAATANNASGGAVWMNLGYALVSGCEFVSGQAVFGGGISFNNMNSAMVRNSSFINNSAVLAGGGVANNHGSVSVSNCLFTGNSTGGEGGGFYSYYTPAVVLNSRFYNNSALQGGGLLFDYHVVNHTSVVDRCYFAGNSATAEGGGLHSFARNMVVANSLFTFNSAPNGGGIRLHAGMANEGTFNNQYAITIMNSLLYGNTASQYGGGIINSFGVNLKIFNSILWSNNANTTIWSPSQGTFVTTPDLFNTGTGSVETRHTVMQTLSWNHGSVWESHTGSFASHPLFQQPLGPDGLPATADDNFRLQATSPAIDRADGNHAPLMDYEYNIRFDQASVVNQGLGNPNFADIGPYERIQYAETPTFLVGQGTYTTWQSVMIRSATAGAIIYYTTNGTIPTASSLTNLPVIVNRTMFIRALAIAPGFANSDIASANYLVTDTDGDGLPDWMETSTGVFLSSTNTGTRPTMIDTDGDLVADGVEVQRGSDPNNPLSLPPPVSNDFDGDRKSDIGCYFPQGGNWYMMQSFRQYTNFLFGFSDTLPISGDWDGDGRADFGCYFPSSGDWYRMLSSDGFKTNAFGFAGTTPIVGDWDGDGRDDFGCYHPPSGNWYRMLSTAGFKTNAFGFAGTIPIVGDWDGDGRDDFGCYHPPSGNWYRMLSTAGFKTNAFGFAGTIPIVGDWDGDGRDDFGCYHPPSGGWYRMLSAEGFKLNQLGFSGTLPIVGDWDGDGRDDFGCYHPPSGMWYLMRSTAGFTSLNFGFSGTLPIGN